MKLKNEFTVGVPLERAWDTLLDIERVAGFLPGAKIEPGGEEGVYHGSMRVKLGPMTVNYQGTAHLAAVDEQAHTADIEVRAKEAKGQGTASAVIRNTLVQENGQTRVIAETDLQVTGRQAQFGRGIMQDVAGRMLGDFAQRFERYLAEGEAAAGDGGPTAAGAPPPPPQEETEEALDLGSVLSQTPMLRYAGAAAVVLGVIVLLTLVRRSRRRGITLHFDLGG